jgi:nucleoside 2-deoxyribosyltransferase
MRRVYIAGPFRGKNAWEVEQNIRRAEVAGMAVFQLGHSAFIPHCNTRYFDGTINDDFWLSATAAWIPCCDAVLLVDGWQRSEGTLSEIAKAEELGIPVFAHITSMHNYLKRIDHAACNDDI